MESVLFVAAVLFALQGTDHYIVRIAKPPPMQVLPDRTILRLPKALD
jgi:hypothetical protein